MNSNQCVTSSPSPGRATLFVLRSFRHPRIGLQVPNLLSLCLIALLAANYFGTFADLDFAWQIRTGQRILETHQARPPDTFTYTMAGQPVRDFESLYDVLLYGVWSGFGYGGLKLLKTILVASTLVLLAQR